MNTIIRSTLALFLLCSGPVLMADFIESTQDIREIVPQTDENNTQQIALPDFIKDKNHFIQDDKHNDLPFSVHISDNKPAHWSIKTEHKGKVVEEITITATPTMVKDGVTYIKLTAHIVKDNFKRDSEYIIAVDNSSDINFSLTEDGSFELESQILID